MLRRPGSSQSFSLTAARSLVTDLFHPMPVIYWTDFLLSIGGGHLFAAAVRAIVESNWPPTWLVRLALVACFVASGLLYYRSALFIHELVHLPQQKFRAFRVVWNLLCGIPFLMPSFVYYTHIDHHRRKHFGTAHDGEYLPLARHGWWPIVGYLSTSLIIPIVAVFRFAVLTPLAWLHPAVRRWVHRHASSMVIDPAYLRPLPTAATLRIIMWQELACFLMLWSVLAIAWFGLGRLPTVLAVQSYCTAVFILTLNAIRTIGAHRWNNGGEELSFTEQMLDSVTVAERPWTSDLWGPVGTRYHSLHHLFPSLPYHNLPEAHRRLMRHLPHESLYRRTLEPSLTAAVLDLFRRVRSLESHT